MGLFDFLKKKEPAKECSTIEEPINKKPEPYLGDLAKTDIIYQLVQTPKNERDETWQKAFLENIGQASFCCGEPQVITGPDGFPYVQLFLPEPYKSFQCYVIDRMKDDLLLDSGLGVVINPTSDSVDWVLSYGDLLNFKLNKTFYTTTETPFSKESKDEIIAKDEKIMIGQPSETILPKQTRHWISELLKNNGVKSPKILMMMRHRQDGNGVTQDIVFNCTKEDFKDENTYRTVMQTIGWYLPRHYSFVGMDEKGLENEFMTL